MTTTDTAPRPVVDGILERMRTAGSVERVFGEPYEQDGIAVLPVASIRGGGGGGGGGGEGAGDDGEDASGYGEGGGFGMTVRPVGAFVVEGGHVTWRPTLDWTRVLLAADAVLVTLFLTRWWAKRAQARAAVDAGGCACDCDACEGGTA